jgi:hypothetical protein
MCPTRPRYRIRERTLLFHAPKSDRPLRRGIWVTEGKGLEEIIGKVGTVALLTGGGLGIGKEGDT